MMLAHLHRAGAPRSKNIVPPAPFLHVYTGGGSRPRRHRQEPRTHRTDAVDATSAINTAHSWIIRCPQIATAAEQHVEEHRADFVCRHHAATDIGTLGGRRGPFMIHHQVCRRCWRSSSNHHFHDRTHDEQQTGGRRRACGGAEEYVTNVNPWRQINPAQTRAFHAAVSREGRFSAG